MTIVLTFTIRINVARIVSKESSNRKDYHIKIKKKYYTYLDENSGDACWNDNDNDTVKNLLDNCPNNSLIWATDFRKYTTVALDPIGTAQVDPVWVIHHEGAEIQQLYNSDPGLAIGNVVICINLYLLINLFIYYSSCKRYLYTVTFTTAFT